MLALKPQWEDKPEKSPCETNLWPSNRQLTVASGLFLQSWFDWDSCHRLRVRAQRWLLEHPGVGGRTSAQHWGPWQYPVPWNHHVARWNPARPGARVLSTPRSPGKFYLNPQHLREISTKKVTLAASRFILQVLSERSAGQQLPSPFLCIPPRQDGLVCLGLQNTENCSLVLDKLLDDFLPFGKRPEIEHGTLVVPTLCTIT